MRLHPKLFTFESDIAICATACLVLLALSLPVAFISNRKECCWVVKISTGVAALCAVILVVVNIIMYG